MPERNKVKVVDRGWDKLRRTMSSRRLSAKGGRAASVGIQGNEAAEEHGDMTNVEVGMIQEFGSKDGEHPPERSHIRSTLDQHQKKYQRELDRIAGVGFDGKEMEGELILLGEQYRGDIINKIRAGIGEPVDGRTPLIRTGQYINAFRVVMVDPEDLKE